MKDLRIVLLFLGHASFTTLASIWLKLSASSTNVRSFLIWQIAGNLIGFLGVLCLTGLLRWVPIHIAYPITQGLAVIAVQVFSSYLFFKEVISPIQWLGSGFVVVGIMLITSK